MTYHLAAVRYRSIGERSARFIDRTMNMTAPTTDSDHPAPSDTVVWLRNGGGKSSIMALFYAMILPRAVDFLGRDGSRSLTDYVDNGDTSHTVAVWHPVARTNLLGGPDHVLITGAVYEWDDLRRPADPAKDRDRLGASYYAFFAVPGVLDADTLPFTDEHGRPHRKNGFLAALRQANAQHPQAMDLTIARRQHEWAKALTDRGIDPELFRTQKQMNHVEGAVEDLFKFASAREFVNFLLDLTVAPDKATNVAERLSDVATTLAAKPAKITERNFCREAATGLAEVAQHHEEQVTATEDLSAATKNAADLAATFAAAVTRAGTERETLADEHAATTQAASRANAAQVLANSYLYLYRERAATLRVGEAEQAHTRAKDAVVDAQQRLSAWRLTRPLAQQQDLTAAVAAVRAEAAQERRDTAPLRHAHDRLAGNLVARLTALAATAEQRAQDATTRNDTETAAAEEYERAAAAAVTAARAAAGRAATATARLDGLTSDLRAVAAAGILPGEDADQVQPAAAETADRRGRAAAERDQVRQRRAARPQRRADLTARFGDLTSERARLDHERDATATDVAALTGRADTLAAHPRLRDLTEAADGAPVNLWLEHDLLTRRLTDEVIATEEAMIRDAAARMDDERALDAQARTGLWPTSLDAARVLGVLRDQGVQAETGWEHLRTLIPDNRLAAALTDPDLARLGCGLVIPTDDADRAATILTTLDTVTTALVGVYTATTATALTRDAGTQPVPSPPAWAGLHPGLVDPPAAESSAAALTAIQGEYATRKATQVRARDADRALLGDLTRFVRDCPAGHLDALTGRVSDLDAALAAADTALIRVRDDLKRLAADDQADARTDQDLTDQISTLTGHLATLEDLARKVDQATAWREDLATAAARERIESERADERASHARGRRDAAAAARNDADQASRDASTHRQDAARVTFLDARPGNLTDDSPLTVDGIRAGLADAARAYEIRTSASVLAERDRGLTERLSGVAAQVAAETTPVRDLATALLATPDGQSDDTRAAAVTAAEQAKTAADGHCAVTETALNTAQTTLTQVTAVRTEAPRRTLPVRPTSAEHADALAAEQELAAQRAQEARSAAERNLATLQARDAALAARSKTFTLLQDGLPDPAGESAEPFAGDEDAAQHLKQRTRAALTDATERHRQVEVAIGQAVSRLRSIGGKYATVTTPSRDRLVNDREDALAANAQTLATNLTLRADMIEGELAGISKDQAIITDSLAHLVSDNLESLKRAERYSKLPHTLGAWAGKHMLRIRFDAPASEADLRTYIDRVIDRKVAEGVKPEGMPLLKEALHEAVGPRGFTVKILKPTEGTETTSEDITHLGRWSGGEKLTVGVALYCTLAAVRAANSGRQDRSGGILMLDNPIGRASHGTLVRLQRDVAAAHGVQLIYTTGVKDPDAVSRFPNVIRLDNRPGNTRNRRVVVDITDQQDGAGYLTGTRVAHTDHDTAADRHQP